jgi:hypothetical protein
VSGLGFQLLDRTHDDAAKGHDYRAPVDYKSAYRRLWGLA